MKAFPILVLSLSLSAVAITGAAIDFAAIRPTLYVEVARLT